MTSNENDSKLKLTQIDICEVSGINKEVCSKEITKAALARSEWEGRVQMKTSLQVKAGAQGTC